MPVVSDFVFSAGVAGLWIQLVNNITGAIFMSTSATDSAGRFTVSGGPPPAGDYTLNTSVVNGAPWTLRNPHYLLPTIGQADNNFPMAGPDPWFDSTHPSFAGGAKLNNATNDLAALNAAGLAAFNAGGGWVLVPNLGLGPGLYNGNIILRTNVTWMGLGFGSTLKRSGAGGFFWNNVACNGARIVNLTLDGNLQNFDLINFGTSNYCVLEGCQLMNAEPAAAHVKLAGGTGHVIRHNIFTGPGGGATGAGVYVISGTTNSQIVHNYLNGVGTATGSQIAIGPGMSGVNACTGNLVMGNVCVGNTTGYGISSAIGNNYYNKIHSNHCSGHGISGILANGDRCSVQANTCLSNGLDGIDLGDASNSTCSGNFCGLNLWHGIEVNGDITVSIRLKVLDNICWANNQTNNSSDGIRVQAVGGGGVNNCLFIGNICFDDQGVQRQAWGIREIQGAGVVDSNTYIGNPVKGNVTGGLLITGASSRSVANPGAADNRTVQNVAFANPLVVDASLGEIVVVGALTASTTVSAPLNPLKGQRLTFIFTMNAAGGWLVSWNAAFKTSSSPWIAANAATIMTFTYDGANWWLEGAPISTGPVLYSQGNIVAAGDLQAFGRVFVGTNLQAQNQLYPGPEAGGATQTLGGWLHATGVPANANGNNKDWVIADNGHQYFKTGGVWVDTTATVQTLSTPANPAGTASAPGVMMGLAGAITPIRTGNIEVTISGDMANNTIADGVSAQVRFGTGTAPVNGAALAGTAVGAKPKLSVEPAAADAFPFSITVTITGLTLGTAVWLDLAVAAITGGTASVADLTIAAKEI